MDEEEEQRKNESVVSSMVRNWIYILVYVYCDGMFMIRMLFL